jgi:superfamily I DNA/RNA helicase
MPQVALSADFLKAFAKVPRDQQRKVRQFLDKFRADPTAASINYEPIDNMRDSKVRTVRIDLAYRAIVIHPPKGDVYLMVWVDHHDEAMAWAHNKMFEVNPVTGSFQVWEPIEGAPAVATAAPVAAVAFVESALIPEGFLFAGRDNDTLLLVGVPEPLLAAVRTLRTEADLDRLAPYLPAEATDALYLLAAGYDLDQTLDELDRKTESGERDVPPVVDVADFAAALERPESRREFRVVEDDHELHDILAAGVHLWRVFLHPSQEKLVRMQSTGPARVLGGAGTGKTVVAMHRARFLAKEVFKGPADRILFTTFTKNLAGDIRKQLEQLCGPEQERIEVTNLDAWATRFLRAQRLKFNLAKSDRQDELWQQVHAESGTDDFPLEFYKDEWRQVVQAQDVVDLDGYLKARRVGRGTSLTRNQRKAVWEFLSAYRRRLDAENLLESDDIVRQARLMLAKDPTLVPYRAVVVDELQDLSPSDLGLIRHLAPEGPNDLFLVGDAHQRIYGYKTSLTRSGINVRGRRSRRLKINYRTTDRIRRFAVALLEGVVVDDLDEGLDSMKGYRSLRAGVVPELAHWTTPEQQEQFIVSRVRAWLDQGRKPAEICIAVRRKALVEQRVALLEAAGIPAQMLDRDDDDAGLPEAAVRVATMHRVKGLEFPCVLLASVQAGEIGRTDKKPFADQASRDAFVEQEKRLLYVAATRARDELVVTGYGAPCAFVKGGGG